MFRKISNIIVKQLLTFSGAITGIAILFISIFLLKEGLGLFKSPAIEEGYALFVNSKNIVDNLTAKEIKEVFDSEITNWHDLGGEDIEIRIFRIDEIFQHYSD